MEENAVTDKTFDKVVLHTTGLVLVKFGAMWCGPCLRMKPIIERFTLEHLGKIKVVEIDIDDCPKTSVAFGIKSIPTIMLFNSGIRIATKVGSVSDLELNAFVFKTQIS